MEDYTKDEHMKVDNHENQDASIQNVDLDKMPMNGKGAFFYPLINSVSHSYVPL